MAADIPTNGNILAGASAGPIAFAARDIIKQGQTAAVLSLFCIYENNAVGGSTPLTPKARLSAVNVGPPVSESAGDLATITELSGSNKRYMPAGVF